jgi:hypothetical protein
MKSSQVNDVQYPRIPSKILKGASYEEVVYDVVAEVVMFGVGRRLSQKSVDLERMECRDTQISCMAARSLVEPPEACRL